VKRKRVPHHLFDVVVEKSGAKAMRWMGARCYWMRGGGRAAHLQLASMVSWFSVFSRVRELSDEPENHCALLRELRWQQLLTRFVEGDVAVVTDAGEKKLYATERLNALLVPASPSGSRVMRAQ
jgi:hypothetical protein